MKKEQALEFWAALHANTDRSEVIRVFKGKKSYPKERTLQRFSQADTLFADEEVMESVARKTGWSIGRVQTIHGWWEERYLSQPLPQIIGEGARQEWVPKGIGKELIAESLRRHWRDLATAAGDLAFNLRTIWMADDSGNTIYSDMEGSVISGGTAEMDYVTTQVWGDQLPQKVNLRMVNYLHSLWLIQHLGLDIKNWHDYARNAVDWNLVRQLETAADRGTFQDGVCDICRPWIANTEDPGSTASRQGALPDVATDTH